MAAKCKVKAAMAGWDRHEPLRVLNQGIIWAPEGIIYESDHRHMGRKSVVVTPALRESRNARRKAEREASMRNFRLHRRALEWGVRTSRGCRRVDDRVECVVERWKSAGVHDRGSRAREGRERRRRACRRRISRRTAECPGRQVIPSSHGEVQLRRKWQTRSTSRRKKRQGKWPSLATRTWRRRLGSPLT